MVKVGVVGGTGYAGAELLRILARHSEVELCAITSRKEAGAAVADRFAHLRGSVDLRFSDPGATDLSRCDVVFFATPRGIAMEQAPRLVEAGVRVIALGSDFRLKDLAEWQKWYGMPHRSPKLAEEAVYGLPEMNREQIRKARVVGTPGCYATVVQLGFLPLVEADVVDAGHLIADAKSGVSGAGRKAQLHILFSEAADNFKAYGLEGHRHLPEILQGLGGAARRQVAVTFIPHLTPMIRGIHATLYARLTREVDVQSLFERRFGQEPFVDVLPAGSQPDTRSVRGANECRMAVHRPGGGDMVVVLAVIDNLMKGASGQAVQCMNIMFGLPETKGLEMLALVP
ncbi:MAG TPA: N-acetyl-gamma-glutamyl-phosphate reductase [Burkholderiales bacterium]|nr:N-acetyl-gamma-glutamyl-phosphate reductase [Burkholderiales bacterium]